ncbi:hypothetical protein PybrP1_005072 [[Pythium] brassicae (nom. inval.)]|nr:hypothetical protein PybrP1_005072 [[Pythium] brassicae (nom. inval.)]
MPSIKVMLDTLREVKLSESEIDTIIEEAERILSETLAAHELFVASDRQLPQDTWKLMKTKEHVRVYSLRSRKKATTSTSANNLSSLSNLFSSSASCLVCKREVCGKCSVEKKVAVDTKDGAAKMKSTMFCVPCVVEATRAPPVEVAVPGTDHALQNLDRSRTRTDRTTVLTDLYSKRHPLALLHLERSLLRTFPKTLLWLRIREFSHGRHIEVVPELIDMHLRFSKLTMNANLLKELRDALGAGASFTFFSAE